MDVLRFKHPRPARARLGDLELTLRPLSAFRVEQARQAAAQHLGVAAEAPGGQDQLQLERMARVLAAAARCFPDLIRDLYPDQVAQLYRAWTRVQRYSEPPMRRLSEWLRRRVNDEPTIMFDGLRAYLVKVPQDYYDQPLVDLTDGQVAYWVLLRAAHQEWHVPDSKGRCPTPTRQWLKSEP